MPIGKIESFDLHSKQWSCYIRRVKQFILLNEIKSELQVATLITVVGEPTYNLMCDLCAPTNPEDKTFDELVNIVEAHLEPKRSVIAERHVFRLRRQKMGESLSDYLQNLKHLAATCDFKNQLEENLRDQFVSGLASDDMRSRVFAVTDISYKKAVELALALEAAEKHSEASVSGVRGSTSPSASGTGGISGSGGSGSAAGEGLHVVRGARAGAPAAATSTPAALAAAAAAAACWRCGKHHRPDKCRFKQYNCDKCQRKGHLKIMCKSSDNRGQNKRHFFMEDDFESDFYNIQAVATGDNPYFIDVKINNTILKCEIDTGSKISAINETDYLRLFSEYPLSNDNIQLCSYSGSLIEPRGFIVVDASINNVTVKDLQLYVITNGSRPLLGRSWIRRFNIDTLSVHNLDINEDDSFRNQFINELKSEFPQVFTDKLGKCKKSIRLQLADKEPVFVRARPVPLALRSAVEKEIARMEHEGSIYPVDQSDYGTAIVPVIKKSGEIRICGDYKTTINPKLKRDYYPLPRIDELFAALSGGQEYSKIDLTRAYMQVPLEANSQAVTAISTHVGTFVFKRTPYGLNCVPEKFQKIMEETLRGLPNTVVFLDDICVTGKDRDTHKKNLRAVIERLANMGLTVKIEKCKFLQKCVRYLGFVIDRNGLHPDQSKVVAISDAPEPGNVTQLKAFLGLVNYYGKFLPNLSTLLHPLYALLRKDVAWDWDAQCDKSFKEIKRLLSSDRVLTHYDPTLPLILSVDSSAYGIGAVLSHKYSDGTELPISCASRTLTGAEKNYSQLDKEALAIFYGIQKHHQFLFGRQFILKTDHKPLTYIFGPKGGIPQTAASRLQRWAAKLAAYDFLIEYISSKNNVSADALSRLPLENGTGEVGNPEAHHYLLFTEETLPVSYKEIAIETKRDALLSKVFGYIMFGWPEVCEDDAIKAFYFRRAELNLEHGCIVYKYRIVIPSKLQDQVLTEIHEGHLGVVKMKSIARNYVYWPSIDKDIETIGRECDACRSVRDAPPRASLHPWEFPATPWQRLHSDFAQFNGKYYIVLIDAHSKWLEAEEIRSTSARDTICFFRSVFAKFGLPLQLVTDNGPPFQSAEFKKYCLQNGIKHTTSAPYRPQGNGAAENSVKNVKKALKKASHEGLDLSTALNTFLFQYRNCPHATTGVAPAVALLGRRLRGKLDALRPDTAAVVRRAQERQAAAAQGSDRHFRVGDAVLVRDYTARGDKWTPGNIGARTGPVSYKINLDNGNTCRRHTDQILPVRRSRFSLASPGSESDVDNNQSDGPVVVEEQKDTDQEGKSDGESEASQFDSASDGGDSPLRGAESARAQSPAPPPADSSARTKRAYRREMRVRGVE